MSLCDVQARLHDRNPRYPDMFLWKQEGNVIKAVPAKPLSETAHTIMRKIGFKLKYHQGKSWYELVSASEVVSGCMQSARLREAAKQWLKETP